MAAVDQPITGYMPTMGIHTMDMAIMTTSTLIFPTDRIAPIDPTGRIDPAFNLYPADHREAWGAPPAACPEGAGVDGGASILKPLNIQMNKPLICTNRH